MKTILAITATRSVLAHSNNTGVFAGMADAPEIVQVTVVAEPLWSIVNTPEFPDPKALESVISRLLPWPSPAVLPPSCRRWPGVPALTGAPVCRY